MNKENRNLANLTRILLGRSEHSLYLSLKWLLNVSEFNRVFFYENYFNSGGDLFSRKIFGITKKGFSAPPLPEQITWGNRLYIVRKQLAAGDFARMDTKEFTGPGGETIFPDTSGTIHFYPVLLLGTWHGFIGLSNGDTVCSEEDFEYLHTAIGIITLFIENDKLKNGSYSWNCVTSDTVKRETGIMREDKEQQIQQQLIQADKLASLGTLVAGVVHEINNPNQAIMLNGALIREIYMSVIPILDNYYNENGDFPVGGLSYSEIRDKMEAYLDSVLDSSNRIENIINELKTYARKNPSMEQSKVNVNLIIRSAVTLTKNLIKKATNNLVLELNFVPKTMGNFQRLEQVFINIIQNACQSIPSPDRGIFISSQYDKETQKIFLRFRDEGLGIEEKHLAEVVTPFFSTKRTLGGTGLGLSVSLSIIKQHQGELQFFSKPGEGTTVVVTLPAFQNDKETNNG